MKSKLALILTGAILAITSANVPATAVQQNRFEEIEGQTPPSGYRLVSYDEAQNHKESLCSILGQWDIVRLGNNASMDGSGYGCKIRTDDDRTLGNALIQRK